MGNVIYPEKEYYSAKHTNQPTNQRTTKELPISVKTWVNIKKYAEWKKPNTEK